MNLQSLLLVSLVAPTTEAYRPRNHGVNSQDFLIDRRLVFDAWDLGTLARLSRRAMKVSPKTSANGDKICGYGLAYADPNASPDIRSKAERCIKEKQGFAGTDPGAMSTASRGGPGGAIATIVQNSLIQKACPSEAKAAIRWKPGPCTPPTN